MLNVYVCEKAREKARGEPVRVSVRGDRALCMQAITVTNLQLALGFILVT